jgi:hypothetical protein
MESTSAKQLNFNFKESARDMMPDDIILDELLYVLKNHSGSEIERYYYFEKIEVKRKNN